jgi:hypothetical protein
MAVRPTAHDGVLNGRTQMSTAMMKIGIHAASQRAKEHSRIRSAVLLVISVVLFALLGIAVPYKTYKYLKAKQDAAAASVPHEEL